MRRYFLLSAILVLVVSSTAYGEEIYPKFGVGLRTGLFMPTDSDVRDVFGSTWFGFAPCFAAHINENISLRLDIEYKEASATETFLGISFKEKLTLFDIQPKFLYRFNPEGPGSAYVGGGLDFCSVRVKVSALGISDSETESDIGLNILGGYEWVLESNIRVFVEGSFSYVDVEGTDFGGLGIFVGLSFDL